MILEVSIEGFLRIILRFFLKNVEDYLIYNFTSANAFIILDQRKLTGINSKYMLAKFKLETSTSVRSVLFNY